MAREEDPIQRRHRRCSRFYYDASAHGRQRRRSMRAGAVICCVAAAFSVIKIVGYFADYHASQQASQALRAAYYDELNTATEVPSAAAFSPTPAPAATEEAPASSPEATATPRVLLEALPYPDNPYALVRSRFQKIRRQNSDIIGWLNIDGLLDEAVVQRDNTYYLRRDYRGYHNDNGSLFLEQSCRLQTRPYTLMIYGHNMKTGAMFGCLRNYENLSFYKNNPFISFDTAYEDGRYVIFAVSTVSTNPQNRAYVDFGRLCTSVISVREETLRALRARSMFSSSISVAADDQLLLLITCVGDETDRRVVAARRVRPDETEASLAALARQSHSW